jgi:hypothetical protein
MKNPSHKMVPTREAWIFKDKEIMSSVKRGLKQAGQGKTKNRGSFAMHAQKD